MYVSPGKDNGSGIKVKLTCDVMPQDDAILHGQLIPFSDFLSQKSSVYDKGWLPRAVTHFKLPTIGDVARWSLRQIGIGASLSDGHLEENDLVIFTSLEVRRPRPRCLCELLLIATLPGSCKSDSYGDPRVRRHALGTRLLLHHVCSNCFCNPVAYTSPHSSRHRSTSHSSPPGPARHFRTP